MTDFHQIKSVLAGTTHQLCENSAQTFRLFAGRTIQLIKLISNQMDRNNNVAFAVVAASNALFITLSMVCARKVKKSINEQPLAIHYDQNRIELPLVSAIGVGASVTILNLALAKTFQYSLNPFVIVAWATAGCIAHILKNCKMTRIINTSDQNQKLIDEAKLKIAQLTQELELSHERAKQIEENKALLDQQIQEMDAAKIKTQDTINEMQLDLDAATSKLLTSNSTIAEHETKIVELTNRIIELENKKEAVVIESKKFEESTALKQQEITALTHDLEKMKIRLEELEAGKRDLEDEIERQRISQKEELESSEAIKIQLSETEDKLFEASSQLSENKTLIDTLKERLREVESSLRTTLQEKESMQAKYENNLAELTTNASPLAIEKKATTAKSPSAGQPSIQTMIDFDKDGAIQNVEEIKLQNAYLIEENMRLVKINTKLEEQLQEARVRENALRTTLSTKTPSPRPIHSSNSGSQLIPAFNFDTTISASVAADIENADDSSLRISHPLSKEGSTTPSRKSKKKKDKPSTGQGSTTTKTGGAEALTPGKLQRKTR